MALCSFLYLRCSRAFNRRKLFSDIFSFRQRLLSNFLDQFSQAYPDWLNVVQLDNGAFHKAQKLKIPENIVLLFQPAYSPDTNPIERVWQHLKKQSSWINFETLAALQEKVCEQLNDLSQNVVASLAGYPFILSALKRLNL